jgi:macrocin-O-methyltransferase TylF-like protien
MSLVKTCIRSLAEMLPSTDRVQDALQAFALSSSFKDWAKQHRPPSLPSFERREELWRYVVAKHIGDGPVLYLEFGVFDGYSIKLFAEQLSHPDSRFVGFDTFTGLPEGWGGLEAGTFDLSGQTPVLDDPRVSFRAGLFQDTLPQFLQTISKRDRQLVIHCDADLYSSTLFVLTTLAPLIGGAIVIFDEFNALPHEFRALQDFSRAYRKFYSVIGDVHPRLQRAAVRFDHEASATPIEPGDLIAAHERYKVQQGAS